MAVLSSVILSAGTVGTAGLVVAQSLSSSRQEDTSRVEEVKGDNAPVVPEEKVSEPQQPVESQELAGRATQNELIGWSMYPKVKRIFKDHPLAAQLTCRKRWDYFQINPSTRITVDEKYRDYFMDAVSKECKKQEQRNRSR